MVKIIPIASGKGGVGKSSIAANLALLLTRKQQKVILVDMDLGGSNLHLLLGLKNVEKGIGSYLINPNLSLASLMVQTEYEGLQFIAGDSGIPGLANIGYEQKKALIKELLSLQADYIIIDLGAGTTYNTLDFFLISGQGIIVTAPNVAATLTAYLFLKNAVFRILSSSFPMGSSGYKLIDQLKRDGLSLQKLHIPKLLEELKKVDSENYEKFEKIIKNFNPRLILNLLDEPKEAARAERLRVSVSQYLAVNMENLGIIFKDETQSRSLESGLPVVLYKPNCVMSLALNRICDRILMLGDNAFDGSTINLSTEEFQLEAEQDYNEKAESITDLYKNGAISEGDLLETLRTQQFELNQLRKETRWLKHKITEMVKEKN